MKFNDNTPPQTLTNALAEFADMQATVGETTIIVSDYACYDEGFIVKVNGEEPDGIHNVYYSVAEIERDLVKVVPGYRKGAAIWQEYEEESPFQVMGEEA